MELDTWEGIATGVITIYKGAPGVGHSTLWFNTEDNSVHSIRREITITEDSVTICTTDTPITVNAVDAGPPNSVTITMTKQDYFKRKLAGEFGDIT